MPSPILPVARAFAHSSLGPSSSPPSTCPLAEFAQHPVLAGNWQACPGQAAAQSETQWQVKSSSRGSSKECTTTIEPAHVQTHAPRTQAREGSRSLDSQTDCTGWVGGGKDPPSGGEPQTIGTHPTRFRTELRHDSGGRQMKRKGNAGHRPIVSAGAALRIRRCRMRVRTAALHDTLPNARPATIPPQPPKLPAPQSMQWRLQTAGPFVDWPASGFTSR
jgi:hypothetical protein